MAAVVPPRAARGHSPETMWGRWAAMRGLTVFAAVCFAVFLQLIYAFEIVPGFAYAGYRWRPIEALDAVLITMLAAAPAVWLPMQLSRPSQLMYWLLYVVAYVPSVLIPMYALSMSPSEVMRYPLALLLAFALLGGIYLLPQLRLKRIELTPWLFWTGVGALTLGATAVIIATYGLPQALPALDAIYEVREEYSEGLAASGRVVGLSVAWLVNVAGPLHMAVGLVAGRRLFLLSGLVVELMVFATTGYKSALLAPAALIGVFLLVRFGGRALGALVSLGVLALMFFAWSVGALFDQVVVMSWLVRRFLVTVGLVAGRFYEFFSENGFARLGHSVLAPFVDAPYDLAPPYLVGLAYEGRLFSNNANFWADGYANFGFFGVFVATVVVAGVAYLYDSTSRGFSGRQREVLVLLLVMPSVTLSNSAVITTLASHGMVLVLLVAMLCPPKALLVRDGSRAFPRLTRRAPRHTLSASDAP